MTKGKRQRVGHLRGAVAYLPLLLLPFGVFFSEVWFQTQILHNEYEKNELRIQIRQHESSTELLSDASHELNRIERVLSRAPDLGLVAPKPGQVVDIRLARDDQPTQYAMDRSRTEIQPPVTARP